MVLALLRYVFAFTVIWIILYNLYPRPVIVLEVRDRKLRVAKGEPPSDFVRGLRAMMTTTPIPDGTIKAFRSSSGLAFRFSKGIPDEIHQMVRNLWQVSVT